MTRLKQQVDHGMTMDLTKYGMLPCKTNLMIKRQDLMGKNYQEN